MKTYTVAILGATGAVGREMLSILEERQFPVENLIPLASGRSAGQAIAFRGETLRVEEAQPDAFRGVDLVLGAADNDTALAMAPAILDAGALFVDNSSAFRMDPTVPLVVPEVNGNDAFQNRGIVANPNCSTIIAVTAIAALNRLSPVRSMIASTYQAVSGAGVAGIAELEAQVKALSTGEKPVCQAFPYQIAYNLIPQIGQEVNQGYTSEEMKMQNEGRRILHLPELTVSCTCVRVPVIRSHSISLNLTFDRAISPEEARQAISTAPGCRLADDLAAGVYPMPLAASNQDLVYVGRIRPDLTNPKGLALWCCGDQIRKGAATNAVQIAQLLCPAE